MSAGKSKTSLSARLHLGFESGRRVSFQAHVLTENGETILEKMVKFYLLQYGRSDLIGPVYAAVRELVQNAIKANMKRILFQELRVDPANLADYNHGMEVFRQRLIRSQLRELEPRVVAENLHFKVSFVSRKDVLIIEVINRFGLYNAEENRIREKFVQAQDFDNLFDFYLQFGDAIEGAGMGIAMIVILLKQAGLDPRCFSIFMGKDPECTIARLLIPFSSDFQTAREWFDVIRTERKIDPEAMRLMIRDGSIQLPGFKPKIPHNI
ncbi:MAG: hypothetical protein KDK30_05075 [Leptospiraceae bacterium]|nr:hypothetical protein [Leptospiraceae bacterium]